MGVIASFELLGLEEEDATIYLAQSGANRGYPTSGSDAEKLEAIITQKWLGVLGLTAEQSWFDWSRTGYPKGLPISQEEPNLVRPVRLAYPASELSGNSLNVPSQPDPFTQKIFWAQ